MLCSEFLLHVSTRQHASTCVLHIYDVADMKSMHETQRRFAMQKRVDQAEGAQKQLELQLSELQPHATNLERSLQDEQSKVQAAQTELAGVRAELTRKAVS